MKGLGTAPSGELGWNSGYLTNRIGLAVGLTVVTFFVLSLPTSAQHPMVVAADTLIAYVLAPVMLIAGFISAVVWAVIMGELRQSIRVLLGWVYAAAILSAFRLFVGETGDGIYEFAVQNPEQCYGFGVAIALAVYALSVARGLAATAPRLEWGTGPVAAGARPLFGTAAKRGIAVQASKKATAYHEAGHLITFAALPELPAEICASLYPTDTSWGGVSFKYAEGDRERGCVEWHMHMLLAGKEAQAKFNDEAPVGCEGDMSAWQSLARPLLVTQRYGVFYTQPEGEAERESNQRLTERLLQEQTDVVNEALDSCWVHVEEIATVLLDAGELGRNKLVELLDKVDLPDSFPRTKTCPVTH